jgi:phosphatidylglycerol:prolipoprotein diacylglycerol transferase
VVAYLAQRQAQRLFKHSVQAAVRQRPLATIPFTTTIAAKLQRRKITTVGQLLYQWGLNPRYLHLPDSELMELGETLIKEEQIAAPWVTAPSWRPWNPLHAWYSLGWIIFFGLVGARLYHILAPSPAFATRLGLTSTATYWHNPLQMISLRQGGLGLWGAILGGLIALVIYAIRARLPILMWADIAVVGLALGQALGRWGNFFNQELYGRPTNAFWAVTIDPVYRLPAYEAIATYHPLFLYESLWSLALFALLYYLASRYAPWLQRGDLLALYVIGYASGRVLFESLRIDSAHLSLGTLSLPVATAVGLSLLFLMAAWRRFHYQ